jgi:hypothetical protein
MYFRISVLIVLLLVHRLCSFAQFFTTGTAPASEHWFTVVTPHFRIIFPEEISSEAQKLARQMELIKPMSEAGLQYSVHKLPVVLYNTSVLSNGYVSRAPKRMELVVTPPQDSYAQPWMTQLVLHEYRHAVQLEKFDQGTTRVFSWLTGEIAIGGIVSMIPAWFYEGDAVYNETILSNTGRGRVAGFEMPLRTLLLDTKSNYSYNKAIFGSYCDFVPDHYRYGYHMVEYARNHFGNQVWSNAINFTAHYPFLIWPLAIYLKKTTNLFKSDLYYKTLDSLKIQYNINNRNITYIKYSSINKRSNLSYTSYQHAKSTQNGQIVALKTGLDYAPRFILIDTAHKEKLLTKTGQTMGLKADLHNNLLVWDEIVKDPRWERRDYSEIVLYNLETQKRRNLTRKSRFFSPEFSPDGTKIMVAETDLSNQHYITIIDAESGKTLTRVKAQTNCEIQFPTWMNDSLVLAITVSERGKQIESLDLSSKLWRVEMPYTWNDISEPLNYKNYMLFRGSFEEIDNIFAYNRLNGYTYQVTFSRFGAYNPSLKQNSSKLLFSEYTSNGFDIAETEIDTATWRRIYMFSEIKSNETIDTLHNEITKGNNSEPLTETLRVKPYRKYLHVFNIHSWLPFYTNINDALDNMLETQLFYGVMYFSQNLLSTVTSSIGYKYVNGNHVIYPAITWRGWYPVFELSGQFNAQARYLPLPDDLAIPEQGRKYYEFSLRAFIPLQFNRGKYILSLQPETKYEKSGISYIENNRFRTGIDYIHYKLYIFRYVRMSVRDLYPRWGQFISAAYTQTPMDIRQFGNLFSLTGGVFLPGLFMHHHIYIRGGFQVQRPDKYYLPLNRVDFPRGYVSSVSKQFHSLQVNYAFPAGYPDLSMGPLLYVKRFRINLFYDWSYGSDIREFKETGTYSYTGRYQSYGAEIKADTHIIRFIFPLSIGLRMGYMPDQKRTFSEVLLSIDTGIF